MFVKTVKDQNKIYICVTVELFVSLFIVIFVSLAYCGSQVSNKISIKSTEIKNSLVATLLQIIHNDYSSVRHHYFDALLLRHDTTWTYYWGVTT
jgi:hypothetical protein